MNYKEIEEEFAKFSENFDGDVKEAWDAFMANYKNAKPKINIKKENRSVTRQELKTIAANNVCEIVFIRRRPERAKGRPEFRRMLCSNAIHLLASHNGVVTLNFHFPRTSRRIDEVKHNIVCAWDIMWSDYRNISMESCFLRQTIPADDNFWQYFRENLANMSPQDKLDWCDSP